jgi:hypothetical protein
MRIKRASWASLTVLISSVTAVLAQQNEILVVSPSIATAGTNGLAVTFTLDTDAPPAPPPLENLPAVAIGGISATSVVRPSTFVVTALFDIPSGEVSGAKDCSATFTTPNGEVSFIALGGFTVTGGTTPVVGGTVANQQPAAALYPIVDTAQIDFYNASATISAPATNAVFYGQDGQYVGRQPSYSISSDGLTVYDNVTGLSWTRSHDWNDDSVLDVNDKMTQANAVTFSATLNAANYGGYSDWRLPSTKEIYSLMNFNGTDPDPMAADGSGLTPFIDNTIFEIGFGDVGAGERIIDSQFATTTIYVDTVMGGQQAMFGLNLIDGRIKGYPTQTGKTYYAYYCRGNTAYGVNDFEGNGDGTITDHATGLMWAQADSGAGMDWETALAYAEASELAGHMDWRLPNAKELHSLLDYTRSPATTGSAAIDPAFTATQITNMAGQVDYPWYWSGTTHLKYTGSASDGVYVCFGRGTGTMDEGVTIIDVHGAGCQRSDPKAGNAADYPSSGHGPQGDVQRVFNHVRLVRDAAGAAPDSDTDGMSDRDEIFAGTDPADSNSVLSVAFDGANLSWPSIDGRVYILEYATNLLGGVWMNAASNLAANPPQNMESADLEKEQIFYRVKVDGVN